MLAAWAANPDRLREDANAEADLLLGAYRERVVVELAQNAADAAALAGAPGRLLLRLDPGAGEHGALVAANTGMPLDAAGVRALASLRSSAKREPSQALTGRFGVGFTAVLALTDTPSVLSRDGGVVFSRAQTLIELAATGSPALAAEVEQRSGAVPVLRLPHPVPAVGPTGGVPDGYDTAVVLPLRDAAAAQAARTALAAVDDALLLALPALAEVVVEVVGERAAVLADVEQRWHVVRRSGTFAPGDLAGLAVEERRRAASGGWSLTWALPREGAATGALPGVLLAPTPTDEALPWPAALVAELPLEASRRVPAASRSTAVVCAAAARAYGELLEERAAAGDDVLALVPTGLPAGSFDAALREELLALLPAARLLRPVDPASSGSALLRPSDAVLLEPPLGADPVALLGLAPLVAGLVTAPSGGDARALLRRLGALTTTVGDLVDAMPLAPDPLTWAAWAAALAPAAADPLVREQLATLPVPLEGGRGVRGARGVLVLDADADALAPALAVLAGAGLRVLDHRAAGHAPAVELLLRLGARRATARAVLADPSVSAAVLDAADADADAAADADADADPDGGGDGGLADAVLALVARAVADGELRPGDLPWLQELLLPDAAGDPAPAAALVLPGSVAAGLLDPDEVGEVGPEPVRRWGAAVLAAVGVADALAVLRFDDVDVDDPPEALLDLDGADDWLELAADGGGVLGEVLAVRDLDLVVTRRLPDLLGVAAREPALHEALVAPVLVRTPEGATSTVRGLPAWWLGRELDAAGRADPSAPPGLRALVGAPLPEVAACEPALRSALGLIGSWAELDARGWQRALARCAASDTLPEVVTAADLLGLWRALASTAPALDPPTRVAALGADGVPLVAAASTCVVVDAPRWRQVTALGPQVVVTAELAPALADVLDLDLSSERGTGARVSGTGRVREVPHLVRDAAPGCPRTWQEHEVVRLTVPGLADLGPASAGSAEVAWWVDDDGVHAASPAAAGSAIAELTGRWSRRWVLGTALTALQRGDVAAAASALADEAAG